ncbi:hypothetical protein FPOAC1_002529 [Fusarium poae]|uniref:hypothetical protein n=1 Tax=Fusarium poae TaxID=36050 RepID=UPI001CEADFD1|nr:hypothetical protein FPOAC1_002529 [Fusarium poae]KAG8676524.1 hypothetical protein FPOAC1_002529 [Fusarium poae]
MLCCLLSSALSHRPRYVNIDDSSTYSYLISKYHLSKNCIRTRRWGMEVFGTYNLNTTYRADPPWLQQYIYRGSFLVGLCSYYAQSSS